jgi:serine/threonine protein kinase
MGEVYLAEDTRLHRRVALKILGSKVADEPRARERLFQEARSAATLDHANICTVFDIGDADGLVYIAMQFIEGETLARTIAHRSIDLEATISIARQVADALVEAHQHGIVHRDIKPQNVMIARNNQVRVLDFGLAKITGVEQNQLETAPQLTETGTVAGTLPYKPGEIVPDVPDGAVPGPQTWLKVPGAVRLERGALEPGPDPTVYVFTRSTDLQNLFRVPIS